MFSDCPGTHGRPAAFAYNYHFHGRLTAVRAGFDPTLGLGGLGTGGLGTALLLRSLEDSFARGDESLDLGAGDVRIKRHLRTGVEPTYRLTYSPLGSWKSQLARISGWAALPRPVRAAAVP